MFDIRETQIAQLLVREAALIDTRQWDDWLALMAPDVEYWIPAWDSEMHTTNDPNNELSLMYYNSRQGLEDRVFRIRSGKSLASTPMARTCHFVSNIRCAFQPDGSCQVDANWQVNSWRHEATTSFYGFYHYLLVPEADSNRWQIKKKKIIVLNALIPTMLDIYLV
jgi:3-phenylpropionate/cinnamic acid dioxygenase small subunit